MDFFQTQDDKRKESVLLLVGFAIVFTICFTVVHWFAGGLSNLAGFVDGLSKSVLKWAIFSAFAAVVATGCYKRWRDVAGGGHKLAEHLGAVRVERKTENRTERRLLNMIEEISVAAGISPPHGYILPMEHAINAFVAGNAKSTILVVTQGALTHFNEDELRAVVAHEVAHIANNDLNISMKLLIGLGGLNAITEAGFACYATTHIKRSDDSGLAGMLNTQKPGHHDNPFAAFFISIILGTILVILGSVFTLFGNILKTAFSRKREFLADAKAVQFTRDTWSMASALNTISEHDELRGLRLRYQGEIDHMCIDAPGAIGFTDKWLATHPPLEDRIDSIDPHFHVKQRKRKDRESGESPVSKNENKSTGAARTVVAPSVIPIANTVSMAQCGAELSILISLMIQTAGYDKGANLAKFSSTLKCYTNEPHPMRNWEEAGISDELEAALDKLLLLPAMQKQNLLNHLGELVEHDGILLDEEKKLLSHVYLRLNPADKAA